MMLVELNQVTKSYADFCLDCSLQVPEGCVTGLIGPNGAGKSTAFKIILGLVKPEEGQVRIFGKNAGELTPSEKQQIGVALADSGFSQYLYVKDIVSILDRMYRDFDREWFLGRCEEFHLPLKKKIKEFSTGMQAKLKVLVAMSHNARLLILDEPTAGLDVMAREELVDMIRTYLLPGDRSVLISSHISTDLEGLCDDFYLIGGGKILLHEQTDVLLDEYGLLKVTEGQYEALDHKYLIRKKKEPFGYCCLTDQKAFYIENFPELVMEQSGMDELITMMIKGERI